MSLSTCCTFDYLFIIVCSFGWFSVVFVIRIDEQNCVLLSDKKLLFGAVVIVGAFSSSSGTGIFCASVYDGNKQLTHAFLLVYAVSEFEPYQINQSKNIYSQITKDQNVERCWEIYNQMP